MSLCSNALSTEVGCFSHQHALSVTASLSKGDESPLRLEDNDDEDVDFNPFLKETASLEASSSLSSEIEGLDADVVDSGGNISEINSISMVCNLSSKITSEVEDCPIGGSELGEEEILIRGAVSPCGASEKDLGKNVPGKPEERTFVLISQLLTDTVCEKENGLTNGTDVVNHSVVGESNNTTDTRKLIMDLDDNDAICMRTRARYSLASFTLDELETFLQETDDDDDVQNVDDEEEYRKFLAAVLQGGDGDGQTVQESENVDEEDEDNDADFQIEIEEALESDLDENSRSETCKEEYQLTSRRPETRQNRRQKSSVQNQKKVLGQAKRPLRPLLPTMPNAPIAPFPALDGNYLMPETAPQCVSSTAHDGFLNGFTAHQIGQLHCLIHEHMQLLIQVYSLCVLEPSRQHVASQIQGLISEMLDKRDQVLAWRTMPYPSSCFRPPYVHPSVSYELPKMCPAQVTFESSPMSDADQGCSSADDRTPLSDNVSPSKVRYECVSNGQMSTFQTTEGIFWVPYISRSILSVLDVAPLHLVGRYMDDVSRAKQENLRRHLESTCDSRFEREPLFPLPSLPSFVEAHSQVVRAPTTSTTKTGPSSSPCNQPPKKTLAAALVESTKKQSVALVPKEIVTLAQRFLPLFNPAFYPHKPPPVPVANRVLFTEAEDELLALGLMEYNTDWKAIQQRFLPCKSKHQIFVRQKNRCSSKAPENPIKAVRRMKTSPLSAEEIALIHKGIKVFKLDWMSIWKFIVPYRDPSLLPRQWRIAHGTQKSYKSDSAKKEKRRLYESKRRRCKAALSSWQTASEKEDNQVENDGGENNCGGDNIDNEDEAYVHEAFLADWRPSTSCIVSSESPFSNLQDKTQLSGLLSKEDTHLGEQTNNNCSEESQPQNGYAQKFLNGMNSHHLHAASPLTHVTHCASYTMEQNSSVSDLTPRSSKSQFCLRPYRVRRTNRAHLVKLAPGLLPVNLPPSVRVISHSALKNSQSGATTKTSASGGNSGGGMESVVPKFSHATESGNSHSIKARQTAINVPKHDIANHLQGYKCAREQRGSYSDLQMHPLLFQAPENGCLPYYPLNCCTGVPASFNFTSGNQPLLNLSLSHISRRANPAVNYLNKSLKSKRSGSALGGIDFHPLLQRTNDINGTSVSGVPSAQLSVNLESFRGEAAEMGNPSDTVPSMLQTNSDQLAASDKLFNPLEKENELDLEIHLSSTSSRKETAVGNVSVIDYNLERSIVSVPNSRTTMETGNCSSPCDQNGENCPAASMPNRTDAEHVSGAYGTSMPSNDISEYCIDNINDQSLPEIVMEQEELSDSDDEVGENVEFECEEMADSEGAEGSDSEQMANIQNKEASNVAVEKVVADADVDDQQAEPIIRGNHENNDSLPLDCVDESKHVESRNGKSLAGKNAASSRPKRSCRKITRSAQNVSRQQHPVYTPKHLAPASLSTTPLRKPRKCARRTEAILS